MASASSAAEAGSGVDCLDRMMAGDVGSAALSDVTTNRIAVDRRRRFLSFIYKIIFIVII